MTNGEIKECALALAEYKAAQLAYQSSYDAIHRYKAADDQLRALLWKHGPDLIELAELARTSQP